MSMGAAYGQMLITKFVLVNLNMCVYLKKKSVIKNTISTSEKQACVLFLKTENNGHSGCDSDDSTTSLFSTKKKKHPNNRKLEAW